MRPSDADVKLKTGGSLAGETQPAGCGRRSPGRRTAAPIEARKRCVEESDALDHGGLLDELRRRAQRGR